jgi:hypothetical protein
MDIMKDADDFDSDSLHYSQTYVALVDILGYKQMLESFGDEAPSKLFQDILEAFSWAKSGHESLKVSLFSDTIIIAGVDDHPMNFWNMLQALSSLRLQLMQKGILIRGAITFGRHFSQKGILISPALVEAHCLESKIAVNPRILITSSAIQSASHDLINENGIDRLQVGDFKAKIEKRMLTADDDGWTMLGFDPNTVELRYLRYGEHPDAKNIHMHISHCVEAGNSVLLKTMQGIALAKERAPGEKEKSKIRYVIDEWNAYMNDFHNHGDLLRDYKIPSA